MKSAKQWAEALTPLPEKEVLEHLIKKIQHQAFQYGYDAGRRAGQCTGESMEDAWERVNESAT